MQIAKEQTPQGAGMGGPAGPGGPGGNPFELGKSKAARLRFFFFWGGAGGGFKTFKFSNVGLRGSESQLGLWA